MFYTASSNLQLRLFKRERETLVNCQITTSVRNTICLEQFKGFKDQFVIIHTACESINSTLQRATVFKRGLILVSDRKQI